MKFNKQLAIILVLLSMLLSAIAIAVYFYKQNEKVLKNKNQLVTIYVAKDIIKKDTIISESDIKKTTVARQYLLTKPLLKKEILNKYANETIYKNEAFLKEKLSNKLTVEKKKTIDFKYSSYNMAFKLFKNPNYSLEPDDIIKIISVYPKNEETDQKEFSVQYVAKNIRILGFLNAGKPTEKSIIKKKIKKVVKKKQIEQIIELKSEELILDIKHDILLSLIDDYNKGKQLWMVKSKIEKETEEKVEEKTEKDVDKKKIETLFKNKRTYKVKNYPYKWYQPKSLVNTETAIVTYSNDSTLKQTKKAKIISGFSQECTKKEKLLIVKSSKAYLRTNPSIRAKIHKKIYKNYIIPYSSISKINSSWYMICDGSYIQKRDVKKISYDEYKKLR